MQAAVPGIPKVRTSWRVETAMPLGGRRKLGAKCIEGDRVAALLGHENARLELPHQEQKALFPQLLQRLAGFTIHLARELRRRCGKKVE